MNKCNPDQILNPLTKRCVLRTGAIGKKLLAGEHDSIAEPVKIVLSDKKCTSAQILNPVTKRCVSRDGAIGQKISGGNKDTPDPVRNVLSVHTFSPDELNYLLILLNIEDNNTDKFTQIRHHLAGKFCKCVSDISEKNKGKPLDYPPEQTCRYSIFNRRGLSSHKIKCWDDIDGNSIYNPQLLGSKNSLIVLDKGPSWKTGWEKDHVRKGLIKKK